MTISAHALSRWLARAPHALSPDLAEANLKARVAAARPISGREVVLVIGKGAYRHRTFRADQQFLYILNESGRRVVTVLDR